MKIIKLTLVFILCLALSLSFSAFYSNNDDIHYTDKNITVVFDVDSVLSPEKKQFIADKLVYGDNSTGEGISAYSWCWLTGHDLTTEVVFVIEHKVSATDPRCRRNTYTVESCSKCDYSSQTLFSTMMIPCCVEE